MPSLANHQSNQFTKLLLIGDSKAGKTGALASLVKVGYKLRILDYDNGLDVLKQFILRDSPENIGNVEFRTLRDKRKSSGEGTIVDGVPRAFVDGIKMLDRWKYKAKDGADIDLGIPASWGGDCVLVIDSLTRFGDAAYDFREPLTPRSRDGKYDNRAVYKDAQDAIEGVLALLTGDDFATNVIVISHVRFVDNPDGTKKGYPTAIGGALSPKIPTYFNNLALFRTNAGGKRTLETVSSAMFDLANAKPFEMGKTYPVETGLAEFFGVLREHPQVKPKLRKV